MEWFSNDCREPKTSHLSQPKEVNTTLSQSKFEQNSITVAKREAKLRNAFGSHSRTFGYLRKANSKPLPLPYNFPNPNPLYKLLTVVEWPLQRKSN